MLTAKRDKKTGTNVIGQVSVPTDGKVHATVFQMSMTKIGEAWGAGNMLDQHLLDMQAAGAEILSACPYATDSLVKVVILFRAPRVDDVRPGA